jgi:hypothetical protein
MSDTGLVGCGSAPDMFFSGPQMHSDKGWDQLDEPAGGAHPAQASHRFPPFPIDVDISLKRNGVASGTHAWPQGSGTLSMSKSFPHKVSIVAGVARFMPGAPGM